MFGVVVCPGCRRPRAINLSAKRTVCPRCGKTAEVRKAQIHFQSSDSQEVRRFITKMNFVPDQVEEPNLDNHFSKILEEIHSEKDPVEKLKLMAMALCKDTGTFTISDLEKLYPGKSELHLRRMMEIPLIFEKSPGVYQVI